MAAIPSVLTVKVPAGHTKRHCAGTYDLVVGEIVNGQPLWKLRGSDRWLYSSPRGVWYISAKKMGNYEFSAEAGYLRSAKAHEGRCPQVQTAGWQSVSWSANPQLTIEAEGKQQALRVKGSSGESNGVYELVKGLTANGQPVWLRQNGRRYLYSGIDGKWWIGNSDVEKLKFQCSQGYIGSSDPQRGLPPHEVSCVWKEAQWSKLDVSVTEVNNLQEKASQIISRVFPNLQSTVSGSSTACFSGATQCVQGCVGMMTSLSVKARDKVQQTQRAAECVEGVGPLTAKLHERTTDFSAKLHERTTDLSAKLHERTTDLSAKLHERTTELLDFSLGRMTELTEKAYELYLIRRDAGNTAELKFHTWDDFSESETIKTIEVVCPGVSHDGIEMELIPNGCIVTISRGESPNLPALKWTHRFQFPIEEGMFEFKGDAAKLEHGIFHFAFQASHSKARTWRFPSHFNMASQDCDRDWHIPDEERDSFPDEDCPSTCISQEGMGHDCHEWELTQSKSPAL